MKRIEGNKIGRDREEYGDRLKIVDTMYKNVEFMDMRNTDFIDCQFTDCKMEYAIFDKCTFNCCIFRDCSLSSCSLDLVSMKDVSFFECVCEDWNLINSILIGVDFGGCSMKDAGLFLSDLRNTGFKACNLNGVDFEGSVGSDVTFILSSMMGTDFSRTIGIIPSSIDYLEKNFEKTKDGYLAYKTFGAYYDPNPSWRIKPGEILKEAVNSDRTVDCGCGVNVSNYDWIVKWIFDMHNTKNLDVWECLIRWEWLPGVVVPYNTHGKIRCERVELVRIRR